MGALLTGCATERLVIKTEVVYPPKEFMMHCPHPTIKDSLTVHDLEVLVVDYQSALIGCNADKKGLRGWVIERGLGD